MMGVGIFDDKVIEPIAGGTDGTLIGNTGDKLKTDSTVTLQNTQYLLSNKNYSYVMRIAMANGGVDNPIFLLKNPTGSGKTCLITGIFCSVTTASNSVDYSVYSDNTITTNGTAVTPVVRNINNAQPASAMQIYTLPTATLGKLVQAGFWSVGAACGNLLIDNFIALQPNSNIIVTGDPSANNKISNATIVWSEI